jgi:acid phosphatase type 7
MKHISFKRMLLLLFTLVLVPLAIGQNPGTGASAIPDHITLTWTGDPSTTMTVTWRTDPSVTSGFVQYQKGNKLSSSPKQAKADPREFVADIGTARLFASTLENLSPNTQYSYRVGDGEHWSDVKSFLTGKKKAKSFKFLVASESQSSLSESEPYGLWRDMVHKMYQRNPDARFLVNAGDLVDIGQFGAHWNAWFLASAGVIERIPEMPTAGNHESFGSKETTKPIYWISQFTLPQNGPEGLKSEVYSWDYGQVHFVVLQSQAQEQRKQFGDILKPQQDWLDADLAASKARWKVVLMHKPPYGVMPTRTNDDVRDAFCPIFDKHHVDLVITAHDHGAARTYPIKAGVKAEDPSQGTVYFVDGRVGPKTYSNISAQPWDLFFHYPKDQPTYMVVEVDGKKITLNSIKQDGTVLDTYSITKQ